MTKAFTFAFLLSLLLGNVCLMPNAVAKEMPMPHDEFMEEMMSPLVPMSPVHCTHCAQLMKEQPSPMSAGCAGHCLSERSDLAHTVMSRSPLQFAALALPPSPTIIGRSADVGQSLTQTNGPPGNSPLTAAVVMLQ